MPHTGSTGVAVLRGTLIRPELHLKFSWDARHPRTGDLLTAWVKGLPNRRWDPETRCWIVTGTGPDPDSQMLKAGLDVDLSDFEEVVFGLNELVAPWVRASVERPGLALVRTRFAGWKETADRLGPSAKFDRDTGRFEIPLIDLVRPDGTLRPGLYIEDEAAELARDAAHAREIFHATRTDTDSHAAKAGLSTGIGDQQALDSVAHLERAAGTIPDWFGVELRPYQKLGALSAVAGHRLIADDMGLGKSLQALAVAAITQRRRSVFVVPPITLTHWRREIVKSGLYTDEQVALFLAGRKEPALPETGAAVVSDSLLVSRPELFDRLVTWDPDFLVADEAHRMRGLRTARSEMMRDLADACGPDTIILALTGTPLFSNPIELVPVLQFLRLLDPVFGGFNAFTEAYCRRDKFNRWVPRVRALPELRRLLDKHVWVRRHKVDVLLDLPEKSYHSKWLDVTLTEYRRANADLVERIAEWLDEFVDTQGHLPTEKQVREWASRSIGLISPLRVAAGVAKVPAAVEQIADWAENEVSFSEDGRPTFDRPLIVWAQHHEVMDELAEQVRAKLPDGARDGTVAIIDGRTSHNQRTRIVDDFQAGRVGVLVAQIQAAGVGITLTRSSDAVFVETDWSAPLIAQAEDRISRFGQDRPCQFTTLIAEGTLDAHIHRVRNAKDDTVALVTGRGGKAGIQQGTDAADEALSPADVLVPLVMEQVDKRQRGNSRRRAA